MARRAQREGTTVLVATPHRNQRWRPSPEVIDATAERLRARLAEAGIAIELRTGAEVALEQAAELDDDTLALLRLGDGPWLLLESPFGPAGPELERVVGDLLGRGHRILLAHPERSPALRDHPRRLRALAELGVGCSITAGALEGRFGVGGALVSAGAAARRPGAVRRLRRPRRRAPPTRPDGRDRGGGRAAALGRERLPTSPPPTARRSLPARRSRINRRSDGSSRRAYLPMPSPTDYR